MCSEQCDSKKISYNCPTCSLIREGSYMKCGNSCPDCGADVVWMCARRIIKIFSQSPIIFHRKFQLWKFWNWTTERDMIRSCCSVSKIDWSKSNDGIDGYFIPNKTTNCLGLPRSPVYGGIRRGGAVQWDDPSAGYNGIMDLDMFRATLVWPQLLRCIITIQLNTSDQ